MTRLATSILLIGVLASVNLGGGGLAAPESEEVVPVTLVLVHSLGRQEKTTAIAADSSGISGATTDQLAAITWAIGRFAEAGLELPALAVVVHPTSDGCGGNRGQYHVVSGADVIDLCDTSTPVILHELAHAWAAHHASDEARTAFLEHVGLAAWSGNDVPYDERGTERAAQTMSLCLAERALSPIDANRYATYLEGYEILTGLSSPRVASTLAGD
jgi:hypothetical protein